MAIDPYNFELVTAEGTEDDRLDMVCLKCGNKAGSAVNGVTLGSLGVDASEHNCPPKERHLKPVDYTEDEDEILRRAALSDLEYCDQNHTWPAPGALHGVLPDGMLIAGEQLERIERITGKPIDRNREGWSTAAHSRSLLRRWAIRHHAGRP